MNFKKIIASVMAIAAITASVSAPVGAVKIATCYEYVNDASVWTKSGTKVGVIKFGKEEKCAIVYGRFNWNLLVDSAATKVSPYNLGWSSNYYHEAMITTEIKDKPRSKTSGDKCAKVAHSGWCALSSADWASARGFVTIKQS